MGGGEYPLSWVFSKNFKQIQNQQKEGIQDCNLSLCIQIVSQNIVNLHIAAHNKMAIKTAKFSQISQFLEYLLI